MKKTFIALFAIAMIGGTVVSCKKEKKATDCASAIKKFQDISPTANCATYKAALQDYINSDCFSSLSAEQKAQYNEQLKDMTCPE